ncbi:hypothetical protein ACOMHN_033624 [Nucella lapillus]
MGVQGSVKGSVVVVVVLVVVVCALMVTHAHAAVSSSDDQPLDYTQLLTAKGHHAKRRERRSAFNNKGVETLSAEEKTIFVNKHNALRAIEMSSDMMYMYWNNDLEALAKSWVRNCNFEHSSQSKRSNVGNFTYVGENLFAHTGTYDPALVVQSWYDEKPDYNYDTATCPPKKVCGHYTQVVWAKSYAVGCAARYCPTLQNVFFRKGFLVSCNYGPGGNIRRQTLYTKGKACSACPKSAPFCVQKLCARNPVIGNPGGDDTSAASRDHLPLLLIGCCSVLAMMPLRLIT